MRRALGSIAMPCLVGPIRYVVSSGNLNTFAGFSHSEYTAMDMTFTVSMIQGDETAWLHVNDEQVLKAEVVEGISSHMHTTVNLEVAENAILHVPLNLTVDSTSLIVAGSVTFKNLVVEKSGVVQLLHTSFTASYSQGNYVATAKAGSYFLTSVVLKNGAKVTSESGLKLMVETMIMKRYVVMESDFINITASSLTLERGAQLSVVGKASEASVGDGLFRNGGGYASSGGVGQGQDMENASVPYGTMYFPTVSGSAGGQGAQGGSYIWIYADNVILDGIFNASGGSSETGGGGSGGSIYVRCDKTLSGMGTIVSDGGATGATDAGAGSGGRVAVYTVRNHFHGTYSATGGKGTSEMGDGGPGSVYIQEGREIDRTLKERLIVDNSIGQLHSYLTIDEETLDIVLDTVEMYNFAKLQVVSDFKNRTINIRNVRGDGTGLLRMRRNQKGTLERYLFSMDISQHSVLNK